MATVSGAARIAGAATDRVGPLNQPIRFHRPHESHFAIARVDLQGHSRAQVIQVASGEVRTKAELKGQEDFIPWKRGVSL